MKNNITKTKTKTSIKLKTQKKSKKNGGSEKLPPMKVTSNSTLKDHDPMFHIRNNLNNVPIPEEFLPEHFRYYNNGIVLFNDKGLRSEVDGTLATLITPSNIYYVQNPGTQQLACKIKSWKKRNKDNEKKIKLKKDISKFKRKNKRSPTSYELHLMDDKSKIAKNLLARREEKKFIKDNKRRPTYKEVLSNNTYMKYRLNV